MRSSSREVKQEGREAGGGGSGTGQMGGGGKKSLLAMSLKVEGEEGGEVEGREVEKEGRGNKRSGEKE